MKDMSKVQLQPINISDDIKEIFFYHRYNARLAFIYLNTLKVLKYKLQKGSKSEALETVRSMML